MRRRLFCWLGLHDWMFHGTADLYDGLIIWRWRECMACRRQDDWVAVASDREVAERLR